MRDISHVGITLRGCFIRRVARLIQPLFHRFAPHSAARTGPAMSVEHTSLSGVQAGVLTMEAKHFKRRAFRCFLISRVHMSILVIDGTDNRRIRGC